MIVISAALPVLPCEAQSNNRSTTQSKASTARDYFTDVELVNQDGKAMRLYTDLMEDKVVIINTFFTSCTGTCPALSKSLEKVQN
jgi:cytochrome oxidase Cu insertion factor (SCO1/SenC/PrrC family)